MGFLTAWHLVYAASCRIVAEEQILSFILVLDMLRWGKGGYIKRAVLEIANNKYLLGGKSPPLLCWRKQLQGCPCLPADGKVPYGCCSWGRKHPMVCMPPGLEVQVATPRFLRSSSLWQNRFCMQLRLSSRTWRRKSNTKFLLPGYLIVVMFSSLEVIRAGLCSTETELAWFHYP